MASLKDLETALVNADRAGDAEAARRLAVAVRDARAAPTSAADQIPGAAPQAAPAAEPTLGQKVIGAGEAGLATITAPFAYLNGLAGGGNTFVKRLLAEVSNQPNPEQFDPGRAFEQAQAAAQYTPRTETGREYAGAIADASQGLAPLAGMTGELALAGQAMRAGRTAAPAATTARAATEGTARDIAGPGAAAAVSTAIDSTANAARTVQRGATTLPRRALALITKDEPTPTPGTLGSAGAAATDVAAQRIATAEGLGLTGDAALTKGQAGRDAGQLKFEVEEAKKPETGAALRQRRINQNDVLLRNFDNAIDQTGAEAPTLRAVGQAVDAPLTRQYAADKASVRADYRKAAASPEASAIVDQAVPVTVGEAEQAITSTPMAYINEQPTGLPNTGVLDAARQYAVKLGIAEMKDGDLIPLPAPISKLEQWRSAIGQATGYEPADIRHSTIIKGLIDGQTEPVAGPLYRQARANRTRLAQNYEDRAVIAKLLDMKPGTKDRAVALEDVFAHTMLKGSLDDVRNVRRVLHRSGTDGAQGWRELQGQTAAWIRDEATKSVAADSAGNRVISPAGLDKAIKSLEHDGKLDFIFGKQGAQRMRDINDIAQVAKTVPPEAAINFSNTASTLLTASGDLGVSMLTGVPAPLLTATKLGLKHVKDRKLRARIDEALSGVNKPKN